MAKDINPEDIYHLLQLNSVHVGSFVEKLKELEAQHVNKVLEETQAKIEMLIANCYQQHKVRIESVDVTWESTPMGERLVRIESNYTKRKM